MRLVRGVTPLHAEIVAAMPQAAGRLDVYFCWGDLIFSPRQRSIPAAILAHEKVHSAQQGADPEGWWRRYIADPAFRLEQEIPAHRAEYQWWLQQKGIARPYDGWRSGRHYHLFHIAKRLASPLYGGLISLRDARREIGGDGRG